MRITPRLCALPKFITGKMSDNQTSPDLSATYPSCEFFKGRTTHLFIPRSAFRAYNPPTRILREPGSRYNITALLDGRIIELRFICVDRKTIAIHAVLLAGYAQPDEALDIRVAVERFVITNQDRIVDIPPAECDRAEVVARVCGYNLEDSLARGEAFLVSDIESYHHLSLVVDP